MGDVRARSTAVLFSLLLAVPPADAGEAKGATSQRLRAAAEARASEADLRRATADQTSSPSPEPTPSKPFFKTGRGIAAAALMAGGLGWLIYSKSHDRVKSPANN
jgi:hypothetical protein